MATVEQPLPAASAAELDVLVLRDLAWALQLAQQDVQIARGCLRPSKGRRAAGRRSVAVGHLVDAAAKIKDARGAVAKLQTLAWGDERG